MRKLGERMLAAKYLVSFTRLVSHRGCNMILMVPPMELPRILKCAGYFCSSFLFSLDVLLTLAAREICCLWKIIYFDLLVLIVIDPFMVLTPLPFFLILFLSFS